MSDSLLFFQCGKTTPLIIDRVAFTPINARFSNDTDRTRVIIRPATTITNKLVSNHVRMVEMIFLTDNGRGQSIVQFFVILSSSILKVSLI